MADKFIDKPFFVPQKEIDYIDSVNEELIDQILGQFVDIYKVSVEDTNDNVYGESSAKYYKAGFRVNCLILFEEPIIEQDEFGPDEDTNIEMYFQRNNLASGSLNFYPEMGDIVDWNDHYWEINGTTEPQLFAGHPNYKHNIVATAHRSRLSTLQIEERPK